MNEVATTVAGKTIQIDRSGQGHNWKNIDADQIPSNVVMEIEGEIIGGRKKTGEFVGSNGWHYRWS